MLTATCERPCGSYSASDRRFPALGAGCHSADGCWSFMPANASMFPRTQVHTDFDWTPFNRWGTIPSSAIYQFNNTERDELLALQQMWDAALPQTPATRTPWSRCCL